MTTNTVLTTRVSASARHHLEQCAAVKNVTLSAYAAEVLTDHLKSKGFDVTGSVRARRRADVPAEGFVLEQVVEDLRAAHQKYLDRGMHPERARTYVELEIEDYHKRGVSVTWEDLSLV